MLSEQQKYDFNIIIEALKVKVYTIHSELEKDLPEELFGKYDKLCEALNLLISDLAEEVYYG